MNWISVAGLVAAFCTTVSFVPQAFQTIRTKDTSSISLAMYWLFTFGTLTWFLYGLYTKNLPVVLANAVTFLLSATILYFKIRNGSKDKKAVS
ncbi:SemiSWEET family sugar transporter [Segetibacter aerophilus]|uniref:Sugar transporter SemiSWEET n=1 Tax=Segetibacter aerophilus TaxID=670293 RepID=A0A512BE06_9BACT|nr:SemiSWEET transporter [Segetibacter aerophilus]GEO10198.1 hypothetical protein SAE01_26940 [Segetibacter aerophilus]